MFVRNEHVNYGLVEFLNINYFENYVIFDTLYMPALMINNVIKQKSLKCIKLPLKLKTKVKIIFLKHK